MFSRGGLPPSRSYPYRRPSTAASLIEDFGVFPLVSRMFRSFPFTRAALMAPMFFPSARFQGRRRPAKEDVDYFFCRQPSQSFFPLFNSASPKYISRLLSSLPGVVLSEKFPCFGSVGPSFTAASMRFLRRSDFSDG